MARATDFSPPEELAFEYADAYASKGFRCRVFYRDDFVHIETFPPLPEAFELCLAMPMKPAAEKTC